MFARENSIAIRGSHGAAACEAGDDQTEEGRTLHLCCVIVFFLVDVDINRRRPEYLTEDSPLSIESLQIRCRRCRLNPIFSCSLNNSRRELSLQ